MAASPLKGRRLLITAGPTREPLDPIRFLSNGSSGRMGYALAEAALRRGAKVDLVSGPVCIEPPRGAALVSVETAQQMRRACARLFGRADVVVASAAVGDWRFARTSASKLKRSGASLTVRLVPNPDILLELSKRNARGGYKRVMVGFALETGAWLAHGRGKLVRKDLDLLVANKTDSLGGERGRVALLDRAGNVERVPPGRKGRLAERILDRIEAILSER